MLYNNATKDQQTHEAVVGEALTEGRVYVHQDQTTTITLNIAAIGQRADLAGMLTRGAYRLAKEGDDGEAESGEGHTGTDDRCTAEGTGGSSCGFCGISHCRRCGRGSLGCGGLDGRGGDDGRGRTVSANEVVKFVCRERANATINQLPCGQG